MVSYTPAPGVLFAEIFAYWTESWFGDGPPSIGRPRHEPWAPVHSYAPRSSTANLNTVDLHGLLWPGVAALISGATKGPDWLGDGMLNNVKIGKRMLREVPPRPLVKSTAFGLKGIRAVRRCLIVCYA